MKQAEQDSIAAALDAGQDAFPAATVRALLAELTHAQREITRLDQAVRERSEGWDNALKGWEKARQGWERAERERAEAAGDLARDRQSRTAYAVCVLLDYLPKAWDRDRLMADMLGGWWDADARRWEVRMEGALLHFFQPDDDGEHWRWTRPHD